MDDTKDRSVIASDGWAQPRDAEGKGAAPTNAGPPANDGAGLSAQDAVRALKKHSLAVALLTVLGIAIALIWSLVQPKVYESTAIGVVVARVEENVESSLSGDELARSKALSYTALAESTPVAKRVVDALRLDATPEEMLARVAASETLNTVMVSITAEAETPEEAIQLAGAWTRALADEVNAVESTSQATTNAPPSVALQPLGNASVPEEPASPNLNLNLALGGIAGLLIGLTYAALRYRSAQQATVA